MSKSVRIFMLTCTVVGALGAFVAIVSIIASSVGHAPAADTHQVEVGDTAEDAYDSKEVSPEEAAEAVAIANIEDEMPAAKYSACDAIKVADRESGMFQVADLVFRLPTKVVSFTDNGVGIISIDGRSPSDEADFILLKSSPHDVIFSYKGICFSAVIFNITDHLAGKTSIKDFFVISVSENTSYAIIRDNIDHIYLPGGVCVGMKMDDVIMRYGRYDYQLERLLKNSAFVYKYGYSGMYTVDPSNLITLRVPSDADTIQEVILRRNLIQDSEN